MFIHRDTAKQIQGNGMILYTDAGGYGSQVPRLPCDVGIFQQKAFVVTGERVWTGKGTDGFSGLVFQDAF